MQTKQESVKKRASVKYPLDIRLMHWLMGVLTIGMIIVGVWMTHYMQGDGKFYYYGLHKAFGVLLLFLAVLRFILRLRSRLPNMKSWYAALYAFMFVVPLSGFIMSDASGKIIDFFGYKIPELITDSKVLAKFAHLIHTKASWIFAAMIVWHIYSSLKRYFIYRVNVFRKII